MKIDSEMKAERTDEAEKKRLATKVSHWHLISNSTIPKIKKSFLKTDNKKPKQINLFMLSICLHLSS